MKREIRYFLDQDDKGTWLIKSAYGERYMAGADKSKAERLIIRLNNCHNPNVEISHNRLMVCWNNHEKYEGCEYEVEIEDINPSPSHSPEQ